MSALSHPRRAVPAALAAIALFAAGPLAGCAADDEPAAQDGSAQESPASPAGDPAPAPTESALADQSEAVGPDLSAIDPCALVTKDEAEQIVGLELEEPQQHSGADRTSCTYFGFPTGPVRKVDVYVGQGAENAFGLNRDTLEHEFTEVTGVGDEAYEKPFEFYFRVGEVWVFIGVVRLVDSEELRGPIAEAAARAADRL